jgi:hypothetical protein
MPRAAVSKAAHDSQSPCLVTGIRRGARNDQRPPGGMRRQDAVISQQVRARSGNENVQLLDQLPRIQQ